MHIRFPLLMGFVNALCFSWPTFPGPSLPIDMAGWLLSFTFILDIPIVLLYSFSVFGMPVVLFIFLVKRNHLILKLTAFMLLTIFFVTVGIVSGYRIRDHNLSRMPARLNALIDAIESYHNEKGEYPAALEELSPNYIKALPGTGMIGYGDLQYRLSTKSTPYKSYELYIFCGLYAFGDTEAFIYWPEDNYPTCLWDGLVEKMDKWAYVHDMHEGAQ